ncbi:aldo/keto reductase [Ruoffia tabacinasalis]|uniref:aldo/keto reductase n=1 Tax=Ruoffia tabacinasalis TaxID=87458 RepID=UPI0030D215A6
MEKIKIGSSQLSASQLGLGCMRMADESKEKAVEVINTAFEQGITLFDHADIYGKGQSEILFAQALKDSDARREDIILQSKVGIRDGYFDFSKEHILKATDGILERLDTEYLDMLLLHRPDTLMEPEEVAEAFDVLYMSGKVRYFGVSNQNPGQIKLLQKNLNRPLLVNQLQFGPAHTPMIDAGFNVNMTNDLSVNHDGSILEYCRLNDITIQPWSPFQVSLSEGLFINHPDYQEMTKVMKNLAEHYNVSLEAIVIAWINRHPAKMQTIAGSMSPKRIKDMSEAFSINLTKQEWYDVYKSGGRKLP